MQRGASSYHDLGTCHHRIELRGQVFRLFCERNASHLQASLHLWGNAGARIRCGAEMASTDRARRADRSSYVCPTRAHRSHLRVAYAVRPGIYYVYRLLEVKHGCAERSRPALAGMFRRPCIAAVCGTKVLIQEKSSAAPRLPRLLQAAASKSENM